MLLPIFAIINILFYIRRTEKSGGRAYNQYRIKTSKGFMYASLADI